MESAAHYYDGFSIFLSLSNKFEGHAMMDLLPRGFCIDVYGLRHFFGMMVKDVASASRHEADAWMREGRTESPSFFAQYLSCCPLTLIVMRTASIWVGP